MKRRLWLVVLSLIFSLCVCFCLSACSSCESCNGEGGTVVEPVVLEVPEVGVDGDGLATWDEVDNAVSYAFKIDNGDEHYTNIRNCQLEDGQTISVKAKGDGAKFVDSEYCAPVKYTATDKPVKPTPLTAPSVSVSDGKASWTAVNNAYAYLYQIREKDVAAWGESKTTASTSVPNLTEGQSIRVKALSNDENYTDSGWSEVKTVPVIGTGTPDPTALTVPTVTITDGTASWTAVNNAYSYLYQIREKDSAVWGEEHTTALTSVEGLTEGQSIRVKALSNSENYTDSSWSNVATVPSGGTVIPDPVEPDIPEIFIEDDGSVYWTDVEGASKYEVEIKDDKTYEISLNYIDKRLTDGQSIRVRAVITVSAGDYLYDYVYGEWSEWATYDEPELDIPNGIKFVFTEDKENSNGYSAKEVTSIFKGASDEPAGFDEVTSAGGIFRDKNEANALKFGSAKNNGTLTLSFKKEVVMVIINCKKYGSDTGTVTVNNDSSNAQNPEAAQGGLTFTLATPSKTVTIKSEKRVYIYGVTVFFSLPEALEKPEVEIDPYGIATWDAVANASGYTYAVNGEDKGLTGERRVELSDGDTIAVTAVGDGLNYLSSVSDEKTYTEQHFTLEKPVVTISRGVAYWNIDTNATGGYVYRIDGGEEQSAPADGALQLENGQTIEVRALGNAIFADSGWSDEATYTRPAAATQLGAPVVTVRRDGTVSWTHNEANCANDPIGYKITVDGVEKDGDSVQLKSGETIAVIALGDDIHFTDSPETSLTYTAPANAFDAPANLTVEIEGVDRGAVILKWNAVEGASGYAYIVNENYENAVVVDDVTARVDLTKIDAARLADTWSFRVMALGDGNDEIALNGDYSTCFVDSGYCDIAEFRVQRGGDDAVYTVAQIIKVINYFGSKNLPDDTFKVSGTVFGNTAYGADINITLKEDEEKFVLLGAVMPDDFSIAGENLFAGFTVTAEGKLNVNKADGENRLINCTAEVVFESLNDRFELAAVTLRAMDALQLGTEHTENFTLPTALYGIKVDWGIQASSGDVFSFDDETEIVTVTRPVEEQGDALVELKADLYYGDLEGDDYEIYDPEDKDLLTFDIVIPAIEIIQLAAPKISINASTGVATWTAVEHAIGYFVTYYGQIDDDFNSEYIYEELMFDADDERVVQLYNKLTITVQALGDDIYYSDSVTVSKKYTYYPSTVTPDGTALVFDFKGIPQNDKDEIENPESFFLDACKSADEFKSVTTQKVFLGNSSSSTASHIGGGFLKSGSSSANGKITLTFGKKVNGVIIECQTWSKDSREQVSVNGSDMQTAPKNDWGTLIFNFGTSKASDTVEITTYGRVFIKSITVYLGDK